MPRTEIVLRDRKKCMLEVTTALFEEKKDIAVAIQGISLSTRSNSRTEILATDNTSSLIGLLKKAPCYAIAIDESCDIVDNEYVHFVQFFDTESKVFRDELLEILHFKGNTREEDLSKTFE
ncbi:hypothetical protein ILUMI_20960 [Ignelater luminosus]|uniref:DUF4371 domain-containing protein n=1 Tax=Ignelater luminosus TaxID=2038154 RepID=A0A8K0CDD0_IGNLU|nr:hypothetical protein ILUMI_20960 [Ignelater luminosus]